MTSIAGCPPIPPYQGVVQLGRREKYRRLRSRATGRDTPPVDFVRGYGPLISTNTGIIALP